eukprot:g1955.t1
MGGKGKGGGYPWWLHVKSKGGGDKGGSGGGDHYGNGGSSGGNGAGSSGSFSNGAASNKISEPPMSKQRKLDTSIYSDLGSFRPQTELEKYCCNNIEGAGYGAYKDLKGEWKHDESSGRGQQQQSHTVFVDHVQGDSYAPPSHVRVRFKHTHCSSFFPRELLFDGLTREGRENMHLNRAACDFMQRLMFDYLRGKRLNEAADSSTGGGGKGGKGGWGSSKGGDIQIDTPSQFVLQRSAVVLTQDYCEVRCTISLPAHGRTCEGKKAALGFCNLLRVAEKCLLWENLKPLMGELREHLQCVADQQFLRNYVSDHGLVAFVADGSILPRKAGNDDRPMDKSAVVAFQSPESLAITVDLPPTAKVDKICGTATMDSSSAFSPASRTSTPQKSVPREIRGMAIKRGITLIVGGGFHGKSTLLQALQTGVYDSVPHDGRELIVTDTEAYKIRSEDGRPVLSVDISPFIKNLPGNSTGGGLTLTNNSTSKKLSTTHFSTQDASGSTSQAANIAEAIEAGVTTFLIDEDTCATNFMVRDRKMQQLVHKDKEPIQPFLEKVADLYLVEKISTVLVVGASGDFFDVADTVVCMENYEVKDVTDEAKRIAQMAANDPPGRSGDDPSSVVVSGRGEKFNIRKRSLPLNGLSSSREGQGQNGCAADGKASARSLRVIQYGEQEVELTYMEQLVELSQAKALCDLLGDSCESNGILKKIAAKSGGSVGENSFRALLDAVDNALEFGLEGAGGGASGLDLLSRFSGPQGFYAKPRKLEIAACVNRLRTAKFQ